MCICNQFIVRVFMVKIVQSLCKITILGLSFSIIDTGVIALSYAAEVEALDNATTPPVLQKMNIVTENKLNAEVVELLQTQHCQEDVKLSQASVQLMVDANIPILGEDNNLQIMLHNYINAGLTHFNVGNWAKAAEYLNKVLELVSNAPSQPPIAFIKQIEKHTGVAELNLIIEAIAKM